MKKDKTASAIAKREARYIKASPGGGMGFGKKSSALGKYQGVTVGGKRYTRFSQIKTKPAGKKSLKEKVSGGIKLAIL